MSLPGRRWLELAVRCPTAGDRAALLADGLLALGGRAAEERGGWYVTYLDDPGDLDAFRVAAEERIVGETGLTGLDLRLTWQEHEEWAETWKRGLGVRRIADRIVVRPSWLEAPDLRPDDVEIVLDPGMAFGTAEHGTTRGCLRLLERVTQEGQTVLDVGAGSGILSVAAARLGATSVVAIEGDALACEALRENVAANRVADRVAVQQAWADADGLGRREPVDGVVANIETGILTPLLGGLVAAVRPGGWLILSGILAEEWPELRAAAERAGADPVTVDEDGEWRSGLFRRRA